MAEHYSGVWEKEEEVSYTRSPVIRIQEKRREEKHVTRFPAHLGTQAVRIGQYLWAYSKSGKGVPLMTETTMGQFNVLMDFVRETRNQQQKYLETIRAENAALIERYRNESVDLINRVESQLEKSTERMSRDLTEFKGETKGELGSVRRWYASTIVAILLTGLVGCGGIILSIWMTAK